MLLNLKKMQKPTYLQKVVNFRIGDMGEFSSMSAIKSILNDKPSFCVRGIKISEHLGKQFKELNIDIGKEAEIDLITVFCNGDAINLIFGECKVKVSQFMNRV